MILLTEATVAIKADAQVTISGEDVTTIVWHDGNPTNITNQQILDKKTELEAAAAAAVIQKATDKASATSKLEALGLTANEIASFSK